MPRGRKKAAGAEVEGSALIDWHEPERNAHLLDWRARAREFGVVPVDPADAGSTHTFVEPPEQMIEEEEQRLRILGEPDLWCSEVRE